MGRWAYTYGALAGCARGKFQGFRRIGGTASGALVDSPRHPTEAMPIPHTTTRALPTRPPTAAVHTHTVHGRPRAAGAERFLGMFLGVLKRFCGDRGRPRAALAQPARRKCGRIGRI